MRSAWPLIFGLLAACAADDPPFDPSVFAVAGGEVCDPAIGVTRPLPLCTEEQPCTRVLEVPGISRDNPLTTPADEAVCSTNTERAKGRPYYQDGVARRFEGIDGSTRETCVYEPSGTGPFPLILFYHGAGGNTLDVYTSTSLRTKAESFDGFGVAVQDGFILVSVQGRNLHWPTDDPRDGPHHDVFHRDLGSPSANPDIAFADQVIDAWVAEGKVDPQRIYLVGWSNGGHFAQMYGIARHETATPGGNRVAAVGVYSAADPFHDRAFDSSPSCQLAEYPRSDVPIYLIGRNCDMIACSDDQFDKWVRKEKKIAPGTSVESWEATLRDDVGASEVERVIVNRLGNVVNECQAPLWCTMGRGLLNHVRWPDGINDEGGNDHEPTMLKFLAEHPLE